MFQDRYLRKIRFLFLESDSQASRTLGLPMGTCLTIVRISESVFVGTRRALYGLYWFPVTAIRNYHKQGDFKQ